MEEFEIISPHDQPALLAINAADVRASIKRTLADLGYKIHAVDEHRQFEVRYGQIYYQVVIIEETFGGGSLVDNQTLQMVQGLSMSLRRHASFFLIGSSVETLNTLQAFAYSVHCVINYAQLPMLAELVQKTTAENELFLTTFRDVQRRLYQKG